MLPLEVCFWLAAAVVLYTYLVYPVLLGLLAWVRKRPPRLTGPAPRSVSVVVAAHNEEANVLRRLDELTALLALSGVKGEVIVVSDGSTDGTAVLARGHSKGVVRVLELPRNSGKAVALSEGCALAAGEVLVFADTRQTWAPDTLRRLLENFRDPAVGAVSGDLVIETAPGVMAGFGLYWHFEKWLRKAEGRVHSMVGVTGAVSAVRRRLFRPVPRGTILDDVYWPLQVAMQGYRVVHDDQARAFDRLPERARDEFRRKVRTLSGNFQLAARLPEAMLPWRNPIWAQFVSHKLLRLAVPWALLVLLAGSAALPGPLYRLAFVLQASLYLLGLAGLWRPFAAQSRLAASAASFLVLNAAAWTALWVWVSGKATQSWQKVSYQVAPVGCSVNS